MLTAKEEKEIADMLSGISKDRTHEELQELRELRDQAKATARVSREMAGLDAKRSEAEFLEYATKATADSEFDALIGLTQKEDDGEQAAPRQNADPRSVMPAGSTSELKYDFFTRLAEILNSDQSRSVILSGDVHDLFFNGQEYVPLIPFVAEKSKTKELIRLVYELNGPIRVLDDQERLKNAWIAWKAGVDTNTLLIRDMQTRGESQVEILARQFDRLLLDAIGNPTLALEALRQLTICSRSNLNGDLLILIEAADMLLPAGNGDVASLNDKQLHRIGIVQDWFSDPAFMNGGDSVRPVRRIAQPDPSAGRQAAPSA